MSAAQIKARPAFALNWRDGLIGGLILVAGILLGECSAGCGSGLPPVQLDGSLEVKADSSGHVNLDVGGAVEVGPVRVQLDGGSLGVCVLWRGYHCLKLPTFRAPQARLGVETYSL